VLTSLIRFAFISFLFSSAAVFSADDAPNSPETSASQVARQSTTNTQLPEWFYRELTSIRKDVSVLDATGASKEQILELKERIGKVEVRLEESLLRVDDKLTAQGNYVEAINASTDRFGTLASILGLIASIIAVMFGWISAGKKAKLEAKKHVDDWLESNKAELDAQLVEAKEKAKESLEGTLDDEIASAKQEIEKLISRSKEKIETVTTSVESLKDSVKDVMSKIEGNEPEKIKATSRHDIQNRAKEVSNKPTDERLAEDWKLLAVKSYLDKKFSEALDHINQVLVKKNSFTNKEIADSLFLKGLILGQLDRLEEEIAEYDALLERFKDSDELALQEQVAKALVNKGFRLGQLNRLEEAIAVYDVLFERFKDNDEAVIQRHIVAALCNKAELVLVVNGKDQSVKAIQEAIIFMKEGYKQHRSMMEILYFIIDESTVSDVLSKIEDTPESETIGWSFNEIRTVIENLESPGKEQAEAFARFFEDHHDKAKLKEELDKISKE
jgi:tetratricopeptide (TPR) repeat protein